ncbi:GNAT family N-acetyltransferase [Candidatus Sumerlaeota bacterium]|nr:GNAT family N-acetyltransferase [Candidatus Sumerlaeota bacterium]
MSDTIRIRRGRSADIDAVVELWIAMMQDHEQFEPHLKLSPNAAQEYQHYATYHVLNRDSSLVVAEDDRKIVGYCLAYRTKNLPMFLPEYYGYLSDLAIAPGYQRKGLGASLLKRTLEWMRQNGVRNMQLQVYERNAGGKKFWSAQGFDQYVRGMWLDL